MRVLALETSTMMGSVAIMEEGGLIAEYRLNIKTAHSERLMRTINEVLKGSGLDLKDIDGFAISIGPGSFTGLRIGLSTVKGLHYTTKRPIVAISTLEALAWNIPFSRHHVCPMLDARKKEVYTALYHYEEEGVLLRLIEEQVASPEKILAEIKDSTVFLGDGANIYRELIKELLGPLALFAPKAKQLPSAANVAELGIAAIKAGKIQDPVTLVPKYIRRSEAEIKYSLSRY